MELFRRLRKWIVHMFSGTCELQRICGARLHDAAMTLAVRRSLSLSRQLTAEARQLLSSQPLAAGTKQENVVLARLSEPAVPKAAQEAAQICLRICETKRIDVQGRDVSAEIVTSNLRLSVDTLFFTRAVIGRLQEVRAEVVERGDPALDTLWEALRPGVRRTGGALTEEWGEIGFQGKDPCTDFRGMGRLALLQLNHMCREKNEEARTLLTFMSEPYIPFAATGINVTGLVVQLLEERLLDRRLIAVADRQLLNGARQQAERSGKEYFLFFDEELVRAGVEELHSIYTELYLRFGDLWRTAPPSAGMPVKTIMDFPPLWKAFQEEVRTELCRELV